MFLFVTLQKFCKVYYPDCLLVSVFTCLQNNSKITGNGIFWKRENCYKEELIQI